VTRVSVITAALPSRIDKLAEACASVRAQRHPAYEHLIRFDYDREGSAASRNALAYAATGEYVAPLDDDDVLLPNHLELLALGAEESGADIVYPFCEVEGRPGWNPSRTFNADALRAGNYIPVTALIRSSLLRRLGGWRHSAECRLGFEDWDLWLRALDAGARFFCVPEVTWRYRLGPDSKTFVGEKAAA
jgi:glycosyltransferase involved in cell wall biosynthesis